MTSRRRWSVYLLVLLFSGVNALAFAPQLHGHGVSALNRGAHRGSGSATPDATECAACHLATLSASLPLLVSVSAPTLTTVTPRTDSVNGQSSLDRARPSGRAPPAC